MCWSKCQFLKELLFFLLGIHHQLIFWESYVMELRLKPSWTPRGSCNSFSFNFFSLGSCNELVLPLEHLLSSILQLLVKHFLRDITAVQGFRIFFHLGTNNLGFCKRNDYVDSKGIGYCLLACVWLNFCWFWNLC